MSMIKRIFILCLCVLMLAGCAANETPVETVAPTKAATNYNTATVKRGTFSSVKETSGALDSAVKMNVLCEYENAILKERINLKAGSMIKEGTVIATFTHETSDAELARLELAYDRAVENMESGISGYYQQIAAIQGSSQSSYLQRMQVEYELGAYKVSAEKQCQDALEALEEYKERYTEKQVVAPFDGIVYWTANLQADTEVGKGTVLAVLVDPAYVRIRLDNIGDDFYHMLSPGMKVTIRKTKEAYQTVVVSTGNGAPEVVNLAGYEDNDGVLLAGDDLMKLLQGITSYQGTYSVECEVLRLENMLMVDKKAVHKEGNKYYVNVLEDGALLKRDVYCGPGNGEVICILSGLTEGQQVVLG